MKLSFLPQTSLGKWSAGFGVAFVAWMAFFAAISGQVEQRIGDEVVMNPLIRPYLIAANLTIMAVGLSAFITGIISIVKHKERSVLVFVATFIGLAVIVFLFGEIFISH